MKEQLNPSGKKILDIHKLKSKVVLYLNNEKIEITHLCFSEFNLYVNKELSNNDIKEIKSFSDYSKHLNYALKLIGKYQYTTFKLKKKLLEKEISDININKIMDYINKYHLLDDESFAKEYASMMIRRHKGEYAIKNKLKELGINEATINSVINSLDDATMLNEAKKYLAILNKKYQGKSHIKDKIKASLIRQGYSYSIINKIIDNVKISSNDYQSALINDYNKFKRLYDDNNKIIKALRNKGYSYSKIKEIIKENNDDLY